jgi:hypothetical protein
MSLDFYLESPPCPHGCGHGVRETNYTGVDVILGLIAGCLTGVIFLAGVLSLSGQEPEDIRKQMRAEAIKAGVAEYVVNPETGETRFSYKSPRPIESKDAQ